MNHGITNYKGYVHVKSITAASPPPPSLLPFPACASSYCRSASKLQLFNVSSFFLKKSVFLAVFLHCKVKLSIHKIWGSLGPIGPGSDAALCGV